MKRQTNLAQAIDMAADKARYDECAKKLLSYKAVLAWILKSCIKEFSQYSVQFICENCLKGRRRSRSMQFIKMRRAQMIWMEIPGLKGLIQR